MVRHKVLAMAAASALLGLGTTAFAHAATPVMRAASLAPRSLHNTISSNDSCNFNLQGYTLGSVSPSNNAGDYEMTLTLSVFYNKTPNGDTTGAWSFPSSLPVNVTNTDASGLDITGVQKFTATINSPTTVTLGTTATATYTFYVPMAGNPVNDIYTVSLGSNGGSSHNDFVGPSGNSDHMTITVNGNVETSPLCASPAFPSVAGQLPEVPWAVALPIVGLGMGAVIWTRRQRRGARPVA